ncbi:MAG TPA: hypothetical protein VH518_18075, partial [Tepidisphaeraceae bacterium]
MYGDDRFGLWGHRRMVRRNSLLERLESRTLLSTAVGAGTLANPRLYKLNTAEARGSFFTALPSLPVSRNATPAESVTAGAPFSVALTNLKRALKAAPL